MKKINSAISVSPSKQRKRKIVHLNTHTTKPMRSETDVDIYLAGLKAELMQYINDDNDIVIG